MSSIVLNKFNADSFFESFIDIKEEQVVVYHEKQKSFKVVPSHHYNAYIEDQRLVIDAQGRQITPIRLAKNLSKAPDERIKKILTYTPFLEKASQESLYQEWEKRKTPTDNTSSFLDAVSTLRSHDQRAGLFSRKKVIVYDAKTDQFKTVNSSLWSGTTLVVDTKRRRAHQIDLKGNLTTVPDHRLAYLLRYSSYLSEKTQRALFQEVEKKLGKRIALTRNEMVVYNKTTKEWKITDQLEEATIVAYSASECDDEQISCMACCCLCLCSIFCLKAFGGL